MNLNRIDHDGFTSRHRVIGKTAAFAVFVLGMAYTVVTTLGFLSLESPQDLIGYPYITVMELFILPIPVLYFITIVVIHAYARPEDKIYSLIALVFMVVPAVRGDCLGA